MTNINEGYVLDDAVEQSKIIKFFSTPAINASLRGLLQTINRDPKNGEEFNVNSFHHQLINLIRDILPSFIDEPNFWDLNCQFSIARYSVKYLKNQIDELTNSFYRNMDEPKIQHIYADFFNFISEYQFRLEGNRELGHAFSEYLNFVDSKGFSERFSDSIFLKIRFAILAMPVNIMRTNRGMISEAIKASQLISEWGSSLEEQEERVNTLKAALDKYKTAFNFVGLYDGFSGLSDAKKIEKKRMSWIVFILGALIFVPFIFELCFIFKKEITESGNVQTVTYPNLALIQSSIEIVVVMAMIGLTSTLVLIYFFRIAIHNLTVIKSQILQIELRKTLCQFIQEYVKYAKDIKTKDNDPLSKFEDVIFSGIISNENKLPTTFDGVESIAQLMQSVRSKN